MNKPRAEDVVPVRLKGGKCAYLFLPDPLTEEDAAHLYEVIKLYVDSYVNAVSA